MTSLKEISDVDKKELTDLPPTGTSLHKRRRGEPPATLSVKPQTPSDAEGSSPCTAGPVSEEYWSVNDVETDQESLCDNILQRLKDKHDIPAVRAKEVAQKTKDTVQILDQLEKLLELLNQFVTLKEQNGRLMRRMREVTYLQKLHTAHKEINKENEKLKFELRQLDFLNEAIDLELESEYGQALFDTMLTGSRIKRSGSKWKSHSKFRGSLLRKQRARSAGGDDSDVTPGTPLSPLRRRSDGIRMKEVDKCKVSKWTNIKAAFRWEKAQWSASSGAAGAVAAGAMVGAVALAGSSPSSGLNPEPRDSASLTPGSALSLTPNSSCEELRMETGVSRRSVLRCDENDNTFLHAPTQDDSSTSPSPNKLHKSPWVKMKDIIQTRKESVKKKTRVSKSSPDVIPLRRRSFSDGGESDAPPALTLTIPSSEELESDPCNISHAKLRKQRSLELGARPPQHRSPRASKWTKVKRAFLTSASTSMPSSPSHHSAFFTDPETEGLSSGCEASGVREEIARDYAALQSRLSREIIDRRGKLYASTRPVATEEQLSADFRKKLAEWQKIKVKGQRQPPPAPARQDLSDDFLKKWDEWKRMKDTNTVPTWEKEAKADEVLVQTSTGLFKFQGISRSFTRKLHEWEKSRGIAPEASTSALLRQARARVNTPPAPLTRAQSDGSVAPSITESGRRHASSLSVNDADDFESEYERHHSLETDECDGALDQDEGNNRSAMLVEVEAEEVCTAALLMAVTPRHTPQKPIYTYDRAEPRLLCETSSAITGTAVLQPNGAELCTKSKEQEAKPKSSREQRTEKGRKKLGRQPSIEEDALFIRQTIKEVERGSSSRFKNELESEQQQLQKVTEETSDIHKPSSSRTFYRRNSKHSDFKEAEKEDDDELKDDKRKDTFNGKKKSKSRARLEREQSKPSESDTEQDVDTVTVEIPRRRKRPRRASEKPRTPPLHSDSEQEVFVLKLRAPEPKDGSPEVIVKTTRKIFSPVVRSGETVARAVIPVDVEDLDEVRPVDQRIDKSLSKKRSEGRKSERKKELTARSKSSGDLQESEEHRPRSRPPLPLSPSSQRKPQPKETSPSIRIMIQRYNKKINEEGHPSPVSSGTSSPAWRSPVSERRRPPDMPVGVNIRNNPFLEREVQKSASACQLSRRDQTSAEKCLTPTSHENLEGVLKSHSANALHPDKPDKGSPLPQKKIEKSQETIKCTASTDTIVPDLTRNLPDCSSIQSEESMPIIRQLSDTIVPSISRFMSGNLPFFARSISTVTSSVSSTEEAAKISDRAARIRAARERFLASPVQMRREGTSSASDLRPGDRLSRISCESDVTVSQGSNNQESNLNRSLSTGMVNVEREAWQRVAEGSSKGRSSRRSRFSLARLAARLRRKDDSASTSAGAVSRLCRQSLLVHLTNNH